LTAELLGLLLMKLPRALELAQWAQLLGVVGQRRRRGVDGGAELGGKAF
jgi:hypothetical protein